MNEITSTRMNYGIDPQLHVWGWEIPVYLFLGGMVAGMMIISGYLLFKRKENENDCSCHVIPFISIILLSLGMFALFLDLEHKLYFWRLYTTFQITSPMSWGSWILIFVYPALLANMLLKPPAFIMNILPAVKKYSLMLNTPRNIKIIGTSNLILGLMLGIYTGILLSSLGARPLWNSSILSILFLVSGLSTAAAFIHMIARDKTESIMLAKADNGFLTAEIGVIALMLIGLLSSGEAHINSAKLLISGDYASSFWVFVILMGILIPLFIQNLAVKHKIKHTPVAPLMVITGGLILRFVIVYAGQFSSY